MAGGILSVMRLLDGGARPVAALAATLRRPKAAVLAQLEILQNTYGAAAQCNGVWQLTFKPEWLAGDRLAALPDAEIADETEGTNLLAKHRARGAIIFAEHQTRGRGRRGRPWLAMPGGSILFSARLPAPPVLAGFSLAAGAALWRALGADGAKLRLKWPNDLWNENGEKVGGVLIETAGADIIIGAGINLEMTPELRGQIARPAAGLSPRPPRNDCALQVAEAVLRMAAAFRRGGLSHFLEDAHAAHYYRDGAEVFLSRGGVADSVHGEFAGFSKEGGILIRGGGGVQSYVSGELAHVAGG